MGCGGIQSGEPQLTNQDGGIYVVCSKWLVEGKI